MKWLGRVWNAWKPIAHKIGAFNTKLVLSLVYVIVLLPFNLALRVLRKDLLHKRMRVRASHWLSAANPHAEEDTLAAHRRQF